MGVHDYIGEREACALSGVSAATLGRFAEAGYFRIETDVDGLRLFSKDELESVFGIKVERKAPHSTSSTNGHARPEEQVRARPSPVVPAARKEEPVQRPEAPAETKPLSAQVEVVSGSGAAEPPAPAETKTDSTEQEIQRLRRTLEMYERLITIREAQIKDLEEQRSWLRSRVERMEEKSDRDQLLLLTKDQTIQRMVAIREQKSTLRLALDWLGLTGTPMQTGRTIEIAHQKPRADIRERTEKKPA